MNKQKKELPLPRIIEVSYSNENNWLKRVVFTFKNNKAICWNKAETLEEAENVYESIMWEKWREIEEPKYRPFTWKDRDLIRNKWIRLKNNPHIEFQIHKINLDTNNCLYVKINSTYINHELLLNNYEFIDGTPCGVKVE